MYLLLRKKQIGLLAAAFVLGFVLLLTAVGGIPGTSKMASAQPREIPIYSVERQDKLVALGFNCAWGEEDVAVILEILRKEGVPATFFVVGDWAEKYPVSTRMLYEAGHEVQSHSNKHRDMTQMSKEEIVADVQEAGRRISQITGVRPTLFRAPSGAYDNLLITTLNELGYYPIQWDVDSIDWKNPTPNDMCNRVIRKVRPGSITLFHVGAKNTPEALPLIIKELKSQGYTFATVSDIIYKENYTIDFQGRQQKENPV